MRYEISLITCILNIDIENCALNCEREMCLVRPAGEETENDSRSGWCVFTSKRVMTNNGGLLGRRSKSDSRLRTAILDD